MSVRRGGIRSSKAVPKHIIQRTPRADRHLRYEREPLMKKFEQIINNDFVLNEMYTEVWEYPMMNKILLLSMPSNKSEDFIIITHYDPQENKIIKQDITTNFVRDENEMTYIGSFN